MSELECRELVRDYLNSYLKEIELFNILDLVKCTTCGCAILEEDAHTYENYNECYCDTCWEAR